MIDGVKPPVFPRNNISQDRGSRLTRRQVIGSACAIGALITTGCRTATSAPLESLTVVGRQQPVAATQQALEQALETAGRSINSRPTLKALPLPDLRATLNRLIAAQQTPDLALVGDPDSVLLGGRGLSINVRDSLDRIVGLNGELFPPLRAIATSGPYRDYQSDQRVPAWSIPFASRGNALLVRKDRLNQVNAPMPKSFDDIRSLATKLTDSSQGRYGWGTGLPVDDTVDAFARASFLAYGASLFDPLGLKLALDSAAAESAFQGFAALYQSDQGAPLAPPDCVRWTSAETATAMTTLEIAQSFDFGGLYAAILTEHPELRESIAALPFPSGPKGWFTSTSSDYWVVLRPARAHDRALQLVEHLLTPATYQQLTRISHGAFVPPYAYVTKDPFWDSDPNYPVFASNTRGNPADKYQFADMGYPAPPTLSVANVTSSDLLANAVRTVVQGRTSSTEALKTLQQLAAPLMTQAMSLQPSPTPTPIPFWLKLLGSTSPPSGGS